MKRNSILDSIRTHHQCVHEPHFLQGKSDLLPHLPDVKPAEIEANLARVMPEPKLMVVSATTGEGIDQWVDWLRGQCSGKREFHAAS